MFATLEFGVSHHSVAPQSNRCEASSCRVDTGRDLATSCRVFSRHWLVRRFSTWRRAVDQSHVDAADLQLNSTLQQNCTPRLCASDWLTWPSSWNVNITHTHPEKCSVLSRHEAMVWSCRAIGCQTSDARAATPPTTSPVTRPLLTSVNLSAVQLHTSRCSRSGQRAFNIYGLYKVDEAAFVQLASDFWGN